METENDLNQEELGLATIMLTDEQGNDRMFEFLDLIEHEDANYVVLSPVADEESEGDEDHVVILRFEEETEDGGETYASVDDDDIVDAIYNKFKEKWKDHYNFVE